MHSLRILFLLVLVGSFSVVTGADKQGLTKIEDITWDEDKNLVLSRTGKAALVMEGIEWKHAESEHFVYHFVQRWMAERAAAEAETYYALTKKDLKIAEDRWEHKGQVFIFETELSWKALIEKTGVDRWSGGFCAGNEIYLSCTDTSNPFTGTTLPHELVHLIVNRFVKGRIPLWLNEGVAEQQSRKHFVGYTRPKGFNFLLRPNVVSAEKYIPLNEMALANDYPDDEVKVASFYTQSVRLVQFLVEDHQQDFIQFLQSLGEGASFETAFDKSYGSQYRNMEVFEEEFKKVAISKTKLVEDPAEK
jgi:hypothetical protein